MDSVDATATNRVQTRPLLAPVQHQYGTRIRQNSLIKPSARLRQSPDPPHRKLKPTPMPKFMLSVSPTQDMPVFPPSHVILHPEDASSKVLLAIGRSFLSVDNRAMTIKDLAEMTTKFGLVCQNVSAAGQAITTYIRNHMQRCETQQDHPLMLRHILSGTSADDDLLPALHSRTGGAHCTINPEHRTTNFRRGTMVWYLSRATGAPCPFQRAGIRLCEYGENGKIGLGPDVKERKRDRDRQRRVEQCGQKRKRLLRGCADKGSDSESAEEGKRPPKVKLTLRLKPCPSAAQARPSTHKEVIDLSKDSDSDGYSMSVDSSDDEDSPPPKQTREVPWSLPPYPRRSISIPCYTPSLEGPYPSFPVPYSEPAEPYRRSPSVSFSVASPPPDSEDEDDDYHISMTDSRRFSIERPSFSTLARNDPDADWDFEFDSSGETETQWESPGPRSPSAPFPTRSVEEVVVKQEGTDIHGMLQAWEDMDSSVADAKVVEVVAQAAAGFAGPIDAMGKVKVEELQQWDWENAYGPDSPAWLSPSLDSEEAAQIKQEEVDYSPSTLLPHDGEPMPLAAESDHEASSPLTPLSASSSFASVADSPTTSGASRRHSELTWKDVELLGPDSIHPREFEDGEWQGVQAASATRARSNTSPSLPLFSAKLPSIKSSIKSTSHSLPDSTASTTPMDEFTCPSNSSSAGTFSEPTSNLPSSSSRSSDPPLPSTPAPAEEMSEHHVVVHTCQPCTPAVSATQVEGISVYQMSLGLSPLMRRIDTDFVNISTIVNHLGAPSPSFPNAVIISQGSSTVCGTWVPLTTAQAFVREHPLPDGLLDVFLSDVLFERFPPALQDFHRSNAPGRLLNKFGPHFKSTLDVKARSRQEVSYKEVLPWERGPASEWDIEDHLLALNAPFTLNLGPMPPLPDEAVTVETPLSPTEQEMFHTLCVDPDWDKENPTPSPKLKSAMAVEDAMAEDAADDSSSSAPADQQPLRRSKRVANAIAARDRTRSRKRGSRNSLS